MHVFEQTVEVTKAHLNMSRLEVLSSAGLQQHSSLNGNVRIFPARHKSDNFQLSLELRTRQSTLSVHSEVYLAYSLDRGVNSLSAEPALSWLC